MLHFQTHCSEHSWVETSTTSRPSSLIRRNFLPSSSRLGWGMWFQYLTAATAASQAQSAETVAGWSLQNALMVSRVATFWVAWEYLDNSTARFPLRFNEGVF
jgi:hypothetical protein